MCKLHPELSHDDLANATHALWPQVPTTVISSAFRQSSSAACIRHSVLGSSCSSKPRTPALHPLLPMQKRLSNRKLTPLLMQTLSSSSWVNWEAWLMFTMPQPAFGGYYLMHLLKSFQRSLLGNFLEQSMGWSGISPKWHHWWVFHLPNTYLFSTY